MRARHELQAYAIIAGLVLVTLVCVLQLKLWGSQGAAELTHALHSASEAYYISYLAKATTLGVTALVATVTVVINIINRIVITAQARKAGIDTRTEEERVLFGQVRSAPPS